MLNSEEERFCASIISDSPLEWVMERHICETLTRKYQSPHWHTMYLGTTCQWFSDFPPLRCAGIIIGREVQVGSYRADFGVLARSGKGQEARIAIECDGHTFHEKLPAQASHDRQRDRLFADCGIWTLRYTGEQIREDSRYCAEEALDIAVKRSAPTNG